MIFKASAAIVALSLVIMPAAAVAHRLLHLNDETLLK